MLCCQSVTVSRRNESVPPASQGIEPRVLGLQFWRSHHWATSPWLCSILLLSVCQCHQVQVWNKKHTRFNFFSFTMHESEESQKVEGEFTVEEGGMVPENLLGWPQLDPPVQVLPTQNNDHWHVDNTAWPTTPTVQVLPTQNNDCWPVHNTAWPTTPSPANTKQWLLTCTYHHLTHHFNFKFCQHRTITFDLCTTWLDLPLQALSYS